MEMNSLMMINHWAKEGLALNNLRKGPVIWPKSTKTKRSWKGKHQIWDWEGLPPGKYQKIA
jgi:hypothetical protein